MSHGSPAYAETFAGRYSSVFPPVVRSRAAIEYAPVSGFFDAARNGTASPSARGSSQRLEIASGALNDIVFPATNGQTSGSRGG